MGKITGFTAATMQAALEDSSEENYVSAYLNASTDTPITLAATWYPILGVFTNSFSNFEFDVDKIKCIAPRTNKYEIDWSVKCASDTPAATINVTVMINGVAIETSKMGAYAKTSGEPVSFSGTEPAMLSFGDTVQLVVQSDKAGSVVSFGQVVATITKAVIARQ